MTQKVKSLAKLARITTLGGTAIAVAACSTTSVPPHPLEGTSWRLVDVETSGTSTRLTQELSSRHRLTFNDDGRLTIQLDCNRGNADWSASMPQESNGTMTIGRVASTRALCPRPTFGEELAAQLPLASAFTLMADRQGLVIRTRDVVYAFARD